MSKYAVGRKAYGISDRSGFRYPLNRMRKEWNGLLVGHDEWEPKHPQLEPLKQVVDAQALKDARPETDLSGQRNIQYGFNPVGFVGIAGLSPPNALVANGAVGTVGFATSFVVNGVSATTSVGTVALPVIVSVSGSSATSSVGTVTVVIT